MSSPRLLVVEHGDDVGVGLLGDWLRDAGCVLDTVRLDRGEPLPPVGSHDAVVVMGGVMAAYDD